MNMASLRALDVGLKFFSTLRPHFCLACGRGGGAQQAPTCVRASEAGFEALTVSVRRRQPCPIAISGKREDGRAARNCRGCLTDWGPLTRTRLL